MFGGLCVVTERAGLCLTVVPVLDGWFVTCGWGGLRITLPFGFG